MSYICLVQILEPRLLHKRPRQSSGTAVLHSCSVHMYVHIHVYTYIHVHTFMYSVSVCTVLLVVTVEFSVLHVVTLICANMACYFT